MISSNLNLSSPTTSEHLSTHALVRALLIKAKEHHQEYAAATLLVRSTLRSRFPNKFPSPPINDADAAPREGLDSDTILSDTIFKITDQPSATFFYNCRNDWRAGNRVYALVPEHALPSAQKFLRDPWIKRISLRSVEDFVGQSIDQMALEPDRPSRNQLMAQVARAVA